jgi:V8-like Glu-specific endopeptidase
MWLAGAVTFIITTVAGMAPATSAVITPSALVTTAPSAVGALFSTSEGRLGTHFCTASVVDSPAGDLLVTAAHCVAGYSGTAPAGLAFVPGYDDGTAPYGVWTVTRIFVDSAWASTANPDDDVAFLAVAQPGGDTAIEKVKISRSAARTGPAPSVLARCSSTAAATPMARAAAPF